MVELRVEEFSSTIAQAGRAASVKRWMEFKSPEGDQKEKLLKVQDMKKQCVW